MDRTAATLSRPPIRRPRERARSATTPPGTVPPIFLPHLLAMVGALLLPAVGDPKFALRLLFAISCTYALWMVAGRGRAYLVPSGVFFLASGVFIGLAALYLVRVEPYSDFEEIRTWGIVAFVATVATGMVVTAFSIRWRLEWPSRREVAAAGPRPAPVSPVHFQLMGIVLVLGSLLPFADAINVALADALGVSGVLMLVLAASSRRVRMRWYGDVALVSMVFVVPVIWLVLTYDGQGRLTLAGMGVACLAALNLVRPRRIHKVLVVLAIPMFLVYAGVSRLELNDRQTDERSSVLLSGDGLESMYGPLDTWTELATITDEELARTRAADIGPRWGTTFLTTVALPVPRSLWEDKPKGFGAELTEILRSTELRRGGIGEEHSMAGLLMGEYYVNFGIFGLVLLPLTVGWFLAVLDRAHLRVVRSEFQQPDDWWRATILMCLMSSLGDLFWVGSFTFMARGGMAALVVFALWRFTTRRRSPAAT